MSVYSHFQEVKKAHELPMAEKVGACLTCGYWDAETPRPTTEVPKVGLCVQPDLKGYALIVSGSSACNKWKDKPDAGTAAHDYAEHGA